MLCFYKTASFFMLLQEGVPLKAACSWKRMACVPPPVAIIRSLPVVLDFCHPLCLEVEEISPHLVVSIAGTRASLHISCPLSCLWRFAEAKYDQSHDLSFLASFTPAGAPLSCVAEHTLQPAVHLSHAWLQQPAACPLALTPPLGSAR